MVPTGKTKFYEGLQASNFKEVVEMAGLCNICTEHGAENFNTLDALLAKVEEVWHKHNTTECPIPDLLLRAKMYKGYLLSDFIYHLENHSECATHCMCWYLSPNPTCSSNHPLSCHDCNERWSLITEIRQTISSLNVVEGEKAILQQQVNKFEESLCQYISHLVRGKHQRSQFLTHIDNLKKGETIIVVDYMMKLLFQRLHEPQKDWFGKKGVSLHGAMFIFRDSDDGPLTTEFHDNFSEHDDKQNWFFSASSIEQSIVNFKKLHPEVVKGTIWSDNGAHYKNTSLILWLGSLYQKTGMQITTYKHFEAQKGKTKLDSHYAILKFSLKSYRHEGHDILTPNDIVAGTERLRGTNVYEIVIDRAREPQSAKTWQGISNYFSFVYSYNTNLECCEIMAQEQTGLGPSTTLKKGQMDNLRSNCSVDTGALTHFDLGKGNQKPPLVEKKKITALVLGKENQQQQNIQIEEASSNCLTKCQECGVCFLREGNMRMHRESKACHKRKKSQRANDIGQSVLKDDEYLASSLEKAKKFKHDTINKTASKIETEKESQSQWNLTIQGTALKSQQGKKKAVRFTKQQIAVMIDCYDKGKDLSKRYTPAMCQKEMKLHAEIGPQNILTENQIRSFWSRHHRSQIRQNNTT